MFNRIITVVEMFSSGYISSTYISCRPSSIKRFSRCTLQSRVEIKFYLRALWSGYRKTPCVGKFPYFDWQFLTPVYAFLTSVIIKRPTVSFPIIFLYFYAAERKPVWTPIFSLIPLSYRDYYLVVSDRQATHRLMIWAQNSFN